MIDIPNEWSPSGVSVPERKGEQQVQDGVISFDAGTLTPEEANAVLNTIPIDITFVNKNDEVKYVTQVEERIFVRPKTILGRKVENCHPPGSVHIVEKIVGDFKAGAKNTEEFWIHMGDKYVLIRYCAVHNRQGEYLGTIEVTQDIVDIQKITGEKRLLSES